MPNLSFVTFLNLRCILFVASLIFLQIRRTWSHHGSFYCVHKTKHHPSIEYWSPSCRPLNATSPVSLKPSVKHSDFQASCDKQNEKRDYKSNHNNDNNNDHNVSNALLSLQKMEFL